jgi:hypothetical protein
MMRPRAIIPPEQYCFLAPLRGATDLYLCLRTITGEFHGIGDKVHQHEPQH